MCPKKINRCFFRTEFPKLFFFFYNAQFVIIIMRVRDTTWCLRIFEPREVGPRRKNLHTSKKTRFLLFKIFFRVHKII